MNAVYTFLMVIIVTIVGITEFVQKIVTVMFLYLKTFLKISSKLNLRPYLDTVLCVFGRIIVYRQFNVRICYAIVNC